MPSPRDHRLRVLENLSKSAVAPRVVPSDQGDAQLRMPLIGAVRPSGDAKQPRPRKARRKPGAAQADLGKL